MDDKNILERTYIMIKPDGVVRGLIGEIISRFENKGLKLIALKITNPDKDKVERHYADLTTKHFFPILVDYMLWGPVICMVWSGTNAVKTGRTLIGQRFGIDSDPGSIRGDFCADKGKNLVHSSVVHASDSVECAENEISIWFRENEIVQFDRPQDKWLFEI